MLRENQRREREDSLREEFKRADNLKEQTLNEVRRKNLLEAIRLQDAVENVARLEKVKEKKRILYLQKMAQDQERVSNLQKVRDKRLQHRRQLQDILETEKQFMIAEYEKKRKKLLFGSFDEKDIESILAYPSTTKEKSRRLEPNSSVDHISLNKSKLKRASVPSGIGVNLGISMHLSLQSPPGSNVSSPLNGRFKSPANQNPNNKHRQNLFRRPDQVG